LLTILTIDGKIGYVDIGGLSLGKEQIGARVVEGTALSDKPVA
jgi:hypothetical protein